MPSTENHVRDLERVEQVAEARVSKSGGPRPLDVRIRGRSASFDVCEYDYMIKEIRLEDSGDVVLNVDRPGTNQCRD